MKTNNKTPSIYNKAVLQETSEALDTWVSDMEKISAFTGRLALKEDNLILKIAIEMEISEFIYDLDEIPENAVEGDSAAILSAISKHIRSFSISEAENLSWEGDDLQSALVYLSEKGDIGKLNQYLHNIKADLKDFMKG